MSVQNSYETVMVFSLSKGEENAIALKDKFVDMISANGELESVDEWGKRKLAYLINDEPEGYYALYNFKCDPEFPMELERVFKITDGVLRTLIIRKDA